MSCYSHLGISAILTHLRISWFYINLGNRYKKWGNFSQIRHMLPILKPNTSRDYYQPGYVRKAPFSAFPKYCQSNEESSA